ncbi:MAG: NAD(P)-dependent oxidoreductase [Clostridiales bacterium]|nr:NAD(P)-dependent oxidoreductase [Clostridiales bacterium]MDU1042777.1 NAD(P)-dependent oxidoreductase [Clostridiales bacterium]
MGQSTDWSGKEDTSMDSIFGSRITLLGTGDIGTSFAGRVRGFQPESITGVNTSGKKPSEDYDKILTVDRLDSILPYTDLLVMSLPGKKETKGIMDARRISLLPKNAYIINVGRGSAFDDAALVDALNRGKLAGAALDVMGHAEGNRAIRSPVDYFKTNLPRQAKIYRVGGDEFIVFWRKPQGNMEKKIEKIKTDLKASGISAAIGYCLYDGKTENIEDSVSRNRCR